MKICPYCEKEMTSEFCCGEVNHGIDVQDWPEYKVQEEAHKRDRCEQRQEELYWARQELKYEERDDD